MEILYLRLYWDKYLAEVGFVYLGEFEVIKVDESKLLPAQEITILVLKSHHQAAFKSY